MAIKFDTFASTGAGGGAVTSVNTQTGAVVLSANDLAADHTASNYTAANSNIDGHLSGIDTKLGTIAAGLTYKGAFNATAGTPSLTNALQGDLYIIDTAGTIYGQTWAVGDHLLINEDMGGTITNSKIDKVDNTDSVTSVNGSTGAVVLSGDDLAADHTAVNYTAANANIDGHLSGIDSKLANQLESGDNVSVLTNDAGYITGITGESLGDLSDVNITAAASGEVLKYNGSAWVDSSVAYSEVTGTPTNVSTFANDSGYLTAITGESIDDLSDVNITSATNGQVLSYNGSEWVNSSASAGSLAGLSDTNITAPADGEYLRYNGSAWVDAALSIADDSSPQLGGALDTNGNAITSASDADVTIDPNGTGSISVGADIVPDADATHTIGSEANRFITAHTDINGAVRFKAKNDEGAAISKGAALYIKGISGTVPTVGLADADDATKMPAFGLAFAAANDQAEVQVVTFGNLNDVDTSSFSAGDTLYVSTTAGALTATKPTGETAQLQNIGRVLRSDASAGIIKVGGAGRSAATPNLDTDKIFLGNASNQAVSTALSAIGLSKFSNDSAFISDITGENLGELANVTLTTPTSGQVLSYNGSAWVNSAASAGSLAGLSDVTITSAATGEVLRYNGSAWVDAVLAYSDLSGTPTNVSTFTNDAGYITGITGESIGDLSDVTITAAATGEYLRYNGSAWVDAALSIADDSSPQLGGNIDVNSNYIVSASNGDIELEPNGTGSTVIRGNVTGGSGHLVLNCEQNTHGVTIKGPPHSAAATYTLTLPNDDGTADQVLKTDGSGGLSWVDQAVGGSAPSVTAQNTTATLSTPASGTLEEVYTVNSSSAVTLTLVSAATVGEGFKYQVKRLGTGAVTVDPAGSEYIDHSGQSTFSIGAQYDSITLISDGTNWLLI